MILLFDRRDLRGVFVEELLLFKFAEEALRLGLLEFLSRGCVVSEDSQVIFLCDDCSWVAAVGCQSTFIESLVCI